MKQWIILPRLGFLLPRNKPRPVVSVRGMKKEIPLKVFWICIVVALLGSALINELWSRRPKPSGYVTASAPAFDVPSMVGMNIDQVKALLGPPKDDKEQVWWNGSDENDKSWERNNKELLVTFHSRTRQIVDFFISCDSSSGACDEKQHMLDIGNVREGDTRYRVEFVQAGGMVGKYTGVKIVPLR
jgi:hypothetical protein